MFDIPTDQRTLVSFTQTLIEQCRASAAQRAARCRAIDYMAKTGRADGMKALVNLLNVHLARTAAHIFSPVELKFSVDYDREYPKKQLDQAKVAAKQLTRHWDRSNTDLLYGLGIFNSLKYGAMILKQWTQLERKDQVRYYAKLLMPWQFGVYNEFENEIDRQPVLCETTTMTLPEVWRRIWYLPDAVKLFDRIRANSVSGGSTDPLNGPFLQVLSTNQLQTGVNGGGANIPGGMVNLNNTANYGFMAPILTAPSVQVHELWVQEAEGYTTIFYVEPDVIVSPPHAGGKLLKKSNLLGIPEMQPYTLLQVNEEANYFWGRTELEDLAEPQGLLAMLMDDLRRLIGAQVDKILFFIGEGGLTDEKYGMMRMNGYGNLDSNTKIEDVTPEFPPELLPVIKALIEWFDRLGGFPPIMQGQGESGVRAGTHASTLLKTGSPTLRDRSLIAERQCAIAADKTLCLKEAKDESSYWTKSDTMEDIQNTTFKLSDLQDDWRVTVDSHSSSPIFADENAQLIMAAHKSGIVQSEYVLDNMSFPNREDARAQNKEAAIKKQQFMQQLLQENPEIGEKLALKSVMGGKR